ncbi:MAG: LysO family transporter [Proteiniphilum sp.]|nr:LysO family transporter [Proteiniphilum sp.]
MLSIFLSVVSGILVGYLLRKTAFVKYVSSLLSVVIMLLLFFLGVSVGINQQVVNNFASIGMDAFILTVGGTLGSLLCAKLIYRKFFKKRGE